jgi:hypothetical protein
MRKICLLALPLAIACGGSDSNTTTYVAQMNAANEKPAANSSPGTGTATFTVDSTQTTVNFVVTYTGLSAGSTLSHIHAGTADVAGQVSVPFPQLVTGKTADTFSGSFTSAQVGAATGGTITIAKGDLAGLINAMKAGNAYAQVHSSANPGGEIRGQIHPQ